MAQDIPHEWFRPADFEQLAQLLVLLYRRKDRLHTLVRNRLDLLNLIGSKIHSVPCHLPEGLEVFGMWRCQHCPYCRLTRSNPGRQRNARFKNAWIASLGTAPFSNEKRSVN